MYTTTTRSNPTNFPESNIFFSLSKTKSISKVCVPRTLFGVPFLKSIRTYSECSFSRVRSVCFSKAFYPISITVFVCFSIKPKSKHHPLLEISPDLARACVSSFLVCTIFHIQTRTDEKVFGRPPDQRGPLIHSKLKRFQTNYTVESPSAYDYFSCFASLRSTVLCGKTARFWRARDEQFEKMKK